MKKADLIYREILFQTMEKKLKTFTQKSLAARINTSISNVNHALQPLKEMNAITVRPQNFSVTNVKKILFYWASKRALQKDIVYKTRTEISASETEKLLPAGIKFTAYSAFKFRFNEVPTDYSEVYVYCSEEKLTELKKRFPETKGPANLFVLKKDYLLDSYGKHIPLAQLFVDLWNTPEWYAKDFLTELESELNGILE